MTSPSDERPISDDDEQDYDRDDVNWLRVEPNDPLVGPPATTAPPIADPAPALLNTHEMQWEAFEGLLVTMAHKIDGAYDVHIYGVSGQAQHGIDVVGFFADGRRAVYQGKRYQSLDAQQLESAVYKYARGRRPFDAATLVVAVASSVRETAVVERLARLREEFPDLTIDLWDRDSISSQLRSHPDIVETFFGPATAAVFCVNQSNMQRSQNPSVSADAILRGPIASLGLTDEYTAARRDLAIDPRRAAQGLQQVAQRLEDVGFRPHALVVREAQAEAHQRDGARAREAHVRLKLGWAHLSGGDSFSAKVQVRLLNAWTEAPADIQRPIVALAAAVGFAHEHSASLDEVAEAFDALEPGDSHRLDAAIFLSESAIANRQPNLVSERAGVLEELASSLPASSDGPLLAARLRMTVADSGEGWMTLASTARDVYPPDVGALITARSARNFALIPNPEPSIARWRDAIERACLHHMNDDAADWLYALRAAMIQAGRWDQDLNDLHRHALALRAAGAGSMFPKSHDRESALASLRENKLPDALTSLRRHLYMCVISANWASELDAHELLGDVFASAGRGAQAIVHYVYAGSHKKAEELVSRFADQAISVPIDLLSDRPWEALAVFRSCAAAADLLPDDNAARWCSAAFQWISNKPSEAGPFVPNAWLSAFKAFSALADLSDEAEASAFLDTVAAYLPRDPNTYRHTDDDQMAALGTIARTHPRLKHRALSQLFDAIAADAHLGTTALRMISDAELKSDPAAVVARLSEAASSGNVNAAMAIALSGGDASSVEALARQRLEAAIAPRTHQPGTLTFGTGLRETALLVRTLPTEDVDRFARGMLSYAHDTEESGGNRGDALAAIDIAGASLSSEVRAELFEGVEPYALGEHDASVRSIAFPGSDDPLSRFRVSIGSESLVPPALLALASLAESEAEGAKVAQLATGYLGNGSQTVLGAAVRTLSILPEEFVDLPVDLIAGDVRPIVRALAAVVWSKRNESDPALGARLARDGSPIVRRALLEHLGEAAEHDAIREVLARDPRRSIRGRARRSQA